MDKENDTDNRIENYSDMRRHIGALGIFLFGLILPFISNTIGDLYSDIYPRYLYIINHEGFKFLIIFEIFNLVPITLCVLSFYCLVLKKLRFLPIIITYLFIFWGHFDVPPSQDGLWIFIILGVPLFSIPIFIISFIITLIIGYFITNKFQN
ncbi:MAG: hypothetical protein LBU34_07890 [Planctomycetaceae bacterium]|jgi:hypothetical protein|nr:hypothetical protein [Planctomycetaceae bacterium]